MTDQSKAAPPKAFLEAFRANEEAWGHVGTITVEEEWNGEPGHFYRAAYAKAIEDAAEIAYGIADELQSKAGNASDEDDVEGYDTATTWVDRVAAAIEALLRADAEAQKGEK